MPLRYPLKLFKKPEIINSGILKGCRYPFSGFQRQSLWQGDSPQCGEMSAKLTEGTDRLGWDRVPHYTKRSAKGEFQNSPVDCFERGNALQERAFPGESILVDKIRGYHCGIPFFIVNVFCGRS